MLAVQKLDDSNLDKYNLEIKSTSAINEDWSQDDIWYFDKISGAKVSACAHKQSMNFTLFPEFYRRCMKRYFKTIVTKRSSSHCHDIYSILNIFFKEFYDMGYKDGFLKELNREDIENYLYIVGSKYKEKNKTYINKLVVYVRNFLEYIQLVEYKEAPVKDITTLIFTDDIPKRDSYINEYNKIKFIPVPILQQIDSNINSLENFDYIAIYTLLRETGWRGTDIFNLKYDNCLQQIWNSKENRYNSYLCGEITKTDMSELKIPIRDKVTEILEKCINQAKELSTNENNPKKYLFNSYDGIRKTKPILKETFVDAIKRLIKEKNIKDVEGNLYNFKTHSLRHSRAKEYVEQGLNICIIQQILGHRSLQMTIHYSRVSENTLYEQWKNTETLDIFKVDVIDESKTIVVEGDDNILKYEYMRKNLDAVCVPFGMCSKSQKVPCKQQTNHCLTCGSFCTTIDYMPQYEAEIIRVKNQIDIAIKCDRNDWAQKNTEYLNVLQTILDTIKEQKIIHKNGNVMEGD